MSITKVKLKAAREAISRQDHPTARDAAQQVLEYEPNDYHAYVTSSSSRLNSMSIAAMSF